MGWQDEDEADERNERAYQEALRASRQNQLCPNKTLAYGRKLAEMYYPHLFTQ